MDQIDRSDIPGYRTIGIYGILDISTKRDMRYPDPFNGASVPTVDTSFSRVQVTELICSYASRHLTVKKKEKFLILYVTDFSLELPSFSIG